MSAVSETAVVVLGPADGVPGRPFALASETERDAAAMRAMLERLRALAHGWAADLGGELTLRDPDETGRRRFLAVPDARALVVARDVTAVGFFGQAREARDERTLFELEREIVASFPRYARHGLLSYYDMELDGGAAAYGNLILFAASDVPEAWLENAAHERAVELSPGYYHSVRLHKGRVPGPLLGDGELTIERTKYLDFDSDPVWRAVRVFRAV